MRWRLNTAAVPEDAFGAWEALRRARGLYLLYLNALPTTDVTVQ